MRSITLHSRHFISAAGYVTSCDKSEPTPKRRLDVLRDGRVRNKGVDRGCRSIGANNYIRISAVVVPVGDVTVPIMARQRKWPIS
ncbi:hypothetical protein O988_06949 [Pseudogymnoascus sp. VKM F-3808]|nr:hypothetical protein O988_06949 [Pseudogymnoascus sp. VKM F-3808]